MAQVASRQRLREILDSMSDAVCRFRPDGAVIYANAAYCRLVGASREAVIGSTYLPGMSADEREELWAELSRLSPARPVVPLEHRVTLPSGEVRWMRWTHHGFFERKGELVECQATGHDITDRVEAQRALARSTARFRFLADASALLVSSVDYETMLERVARMVIPFLADGCTVSILERDGTFRRIVVRHVDPEVEATSRAQQRARRPDELTPGLRRIRDQILSGEPTVVRELTPETLAAMDLDPQERRLVELHDLRSYMILPLETRGEVVGAMSLTTSRSASDRVYDDDDLALGMELARRAAAAIDHARLVTALRESDRRKDAFLATLAHELRNPLAAVQHAVDLLRIAQDPTVRKQALEVVSRQVRHQTRMVEDLLDVSRLTRGAVSLRREAVDLRTSLREVWQSQKPFAEEKGQHLELGPVPAISVFGDPARLQQIVDNLVDNAITYAPTGARITVGAESDARCVRIIVEDDGPGIPESQRRQIFEPFFQIERTHERPHSGLGIGLTITRELVRLHGGRIRARSGAGGVGTRMVVELPRTEHSDMSTPDQTVTPQSQLHVLVVDDNRDAADMLAALLGAWGHQVDAVYDGRSAVERLGDSAPDVVLIDIGMPGMDGYATARAIRATEAGKAVKLVALTGYTQQKDVQAALDAGFDRHEAKPVEIDALERIMDWARERR